MENTKGNGRGGWEGAWIREGSNKRERIGRGLDPTTFQI
jgi:hypothetical protein